MNAHTNHQLLAIFIAVAQEASFTKAAQKLGLGKGTVSRAISRLEEQLGAELLHRTTHAVALSTAGTALYERTAKHIEALNHAVQKLPERAVEPSGVLRLTAPYDFAFVVLPEVLTLFARRYPEVQIDLRLSNTVADLVSDGFDLAIRAVSQLRDSTLTMRRLNIGAIGWYAAPSYLARRGKPKDIADARHEWIMHPRVQAALKPKHEARSRFLCDDFLVIRSLAREGAGLSLLPKFVAARYVREGLLEELPLGDHVKGGLALLYPSSGQVPRKVTAFCDFLVEWIKKSRLA